MAGGFAPRKDTRPPRWTLRSKRESPPLKLFHGTAARFLESIRIEGLLPQTRHYVHLSPDVDIAKKVGQRHGTVVVLTVDCVAMVAKGYPFYLSENGVWLTESVPVQYLLFPD